MIKGVAFSQNMFDTTLTEVVFNNSIIGALQPEGDKILAKPANGKPLPFDAQEQAVNYLIHQNTMSKLTERRVTHNTPSLFALLIVALCFAGCVQRGHAGAEWQKCIEQSDYTDAELCDCDKLHGFDNDSNSICR